MLDYLVEYHMLEDADLITSYLPRTIMLHHYVELRLSLRRYVRGGYMGMCPHKGD